MEKSIRDAFQLEPREVQQYSPLVLAYIGDSVYEVVIRTVLVESGEARPKKLHQMTQQYVKAEGQAAMAVSLQEMLSEEEMSVYRRGRNAHPATMSKHASMNDYRKATGWECLMGYLYLSGNEERMIELVKLGMKQVETI